MRRILTLFFIAIIFSQFIYGNENDCKTTAFVTNTGTPLELSSFVWKNVPALKSYKWDNETVNKNLLLCNKYKKRGTNCLIGGGVLQAVSFVGLGFALKYIIQGSKQGDEINQFVGYYLLGPSLAAFGGSIPLYIIGAKKLKQAKQKATYVQRILTNPE